VAHLQNRPSQHTSQVLQKSHQANARQNQHEMTIKQTTEKEGRRHNITYTQAGVSCFVGQENAKSKVQFFLGSSVVEIPACV
jgi:hypothetical protein